MTDITMLILEDHEWFREQFARLDDLQAREAGAAALEQVWRPLAEKLDVHAYIESGQSLNSPTPMFPDIQPERQP